jgi:hypothetical protein
MHFFATTTAADVLSQGKMVAAKHADAAAAGRHR